MGIANTEFEGEGRVDAESKTLVLEVYAGKRAKRRYARIPLRKPEGAHHFVAGIVAQEAAEIVKRFVQREAASSGWIPAVTFRVRWMHRQDVPDTEIRYADGE